MVSTLKYYSIGEADSKIAGKIDENVTTLSSIKGGPNLDVYKELKLRQSEFFFQYFRSLSLEFLYWEWEDESENVPRKVFNKVQNTLYPNGTGSIKIPQLADIILIPDSDWFIKESFVEFGTIWKDSFENVRNILNDLGFYIPTIFRQQSEKGKFSSLTFRIENITIIMFPFLKSKECQSRYQ